MCLSPLCKELKHQLLHSVTMVTCNYMHAPPPPPPRPFHTSPLSCPFIPAGHTLNDLAKHDVPAVEVRRRPHCDEELAAVGVRAGVGH